MGNVGLLASSARSSHAKYGDGHEDDARILYVDDEAEARGVFREILANSGLQVDVAASASEAISLTDDTSYAVVATDLRMPGVDGMQLIEKLHGADPAPSFVLVTGLPDLDLPTDSESARSITCVIQKPWDVEELEKALRRGIELHRTRTKANSAAEDTMSVLLIEDNRGDAYLVERMLTQGQRHPYSVVHVERLTDALAKLEKESFHLVLADLSLPDARGIDGVTRLQATVPSTPIVVMSGLSDEELAVQVVQIGAQDYLVKGEVDAHSLQRAIRYAVERKATEERLANLAHYDQVTGLANRNTFQENVTHALAQARRHHGSHPAVFMLDLDRFKTVNDTLGHHVGDILLARVAERLKTAVRETDTVARLGGDEFAVLVGDIKKEGHLDAPAKRFIEALEPEIYIGEHALRVTASIGIAVFPQNGEQLDELLRNADSAMYRAKENGRNNYQFFDEEMHQRALQRMQLERDLGGALEREEFQIHYQPLSRCWDGQAVSFEALLRWQHPTRGVIRPDEFVPLLEDLGQIVPVGEWVLRRACAQVRDWQEQFGRELRVAINVSARQFDDPDLVAKVARALRAASVEPSSLELEVTESLVMRDLGAATKTLHRLKDIGVRIAIDDFGTGYSQFVSLVRFPIDVLKIDRSVIETIGKNEGSTVTKALIDLGHTLGLEVVAEGVEQDSQLQFLREQMCDSFQGYLTTRPLSSSGCTEWLTEKVSATNLV